MLAGRFQDSTALIMHCVSWKVSILCVCTFDVGALSSAGCWGIRWKAVRTGRLCCYNWRTDQSLQTLCSVWHFCQFWRLHGGITITNEYFDIWPAVSQKCHAFLFAMTLFCQHHYA